MSTSVCTKLNYCRYMSGSGVGNISNSDRTALNRRASYCCCNKVRYIKVFFDPPIDGTIQISQLAVYSKCINIAPNGTPSALNTYGFDTSANYPIDGTLEARAFPFIYQSYEPSNFGYWLLDLGQEFFVDKIVYYNRSDSNSDRANGMLIATYGKNFPNNSVPLKQFILNSDLIQTFNC